jgi:hypothetical protein
MKVKKHLNMQKDNSGCLICHFSKPGVQTPMTQTFELHNETVARNGYVSDAEAFT